MDIEHRQKIRQLFKQLSYDRTFSGWEVKFIYDLYHFPDSYYLTRNQIESLHQIYIDHVTNGCVENPPQFVLENVLRVEREKEKHIHHLATQLDVQNIRMQGIEKALVIIAEALEDDGPKPKRSIH